MRSVGESFPAFRLQAVVGLDPGKEFQEITEPSYPGATFIVDPEGLIRFASAHDLSVGRNVDEVLRVLDALQTGELCPCNWRTGEPTLTAA